MQHLPSKIKGNFGLLRGMILKRTKGALELNKKDPDHETNQKLVRRNMVGEKMNPHE